MFTNYTCIRYAEEHSSRILDLPFEIRLMVYDYTFNSVQQFDYFVGCSTPILKLDAKKPLNITKIPKHIVMY